MAVVFKRLPGVTFCWMLIRPQSTAGHGEVYWETLPSPSLSLSLSVCLISVLYYLVAGTAPAPPQCGVVKINSSLHVLLITTNLNTAATFLRSPIPPPFPNPKPSPPILSPITLYTGDEQHQNYFDPSSVPQTDPRHCRTAEASTEDELELSMPFSVIIVLLGSLKWGERDHRQQTVILRVTRQSM